MKTKKQSTRFITIGLLLIAAALGLVAYNIYDNFRAMQAATEVVYLLDATITEEEILAEKAAAEKPPEETAPEALQIEPWRGKTMPVKTVNGEDYIGTLELPRYGLVLPIISQWSYPRLKVAPCRYTGSAYTDDLIISAHNYQSHFGLIVELEQGDEVLFTDMSGNLFHYVVIRQETLEATAIEEMAAGNWDLTMFTCTIGGTYRVAVRCERLTEGQSKSELITLAQEDDGIGDSIVERRPSAVRETEPPQETYTIPVSSGSLEDTIPLYFQNDYPYTMYGSGTIESGGCSVTSLAMVASYLTEHEYLPDELARYFGGRAENNIARLEYGSTAMKLAYRKSPNWHHTYAALQEGKIAIVLVNSRSIFTESQHFIVLTGLTPEGKVLVNDPYLPNYDNWLLRVGFSNGFNPSDIVQGYDGAWIYDKSAMPEEPFLYSEPDLDRSNPRYPEIELTYDDRQLIARVVWAEARGESPEGQQAVAEVILNRLASEHFPDNLHDVIYGQNQFRTVSVLDDAEPYQAQYDAIDRAVYGPHVLPEDVVYFATYKTNENVWGQIGGHIFCRREE